MSTWNPYNTVLMTATFASAPGQPAIRGAHHFAQSPFGAQQRNFELVAPGGSGGLVHVSRNGDRWPPPWGNPYRAGTESGRVDATALDAVSLVVSRTLRHENTLEVVGCTGDRLVHYWRDAVDPWRWHGPYEIIAVALDDSRSAVHGVSGNPALAQSRYGVMRQNLELIVPDAQRGIRHLYREQDDDRFTPWRLAPSFAAGTGRIDAVTMIVSNFTDRGNLEVVARAGDRLWFAWRDASLAWNGPIALVADGVDVKGAAGVPSLIQSTYGVQKRNFELAVPLAGGGIGLFFRDNDPPTPVQWAWHAMGVLDTGRHYSAVSLIEFLLREIGA